MRERYEREKVEKEREGRSASIEKMIEIKKQRKRTLLTGAQREAKAQVAALGGGPQGAAVDDIVAALSGRVSEALVRDAVGFLLEEGHLYSTVDENHVKVA